MARSRQNVIVAIHGVGAPEPGSIITELSLQFPGTPFTREDVLLHGKPFARLSAPPGGVPDLLEVNWSDIKRPPKSLSGIVEWTIALSIALARADLSWSRTKLRTLRMHAYFLEAVLLWIVYPVLIGFMHANLQSWSRGAADAVVIGMAFLTYWMSRKATTLAGSAGIVTIVLLVLLVAALWKWPQLAHFVDPIAVRAYGIAQMAAGILITATAVEIGTNLVRRTITLPGATGRLALTYLPLALLSALGSCVWAVSLNVVLRLREWQNIDPARSKLVDSAWEQMFSTNLGYDLKSVEFAMAGASFALGCFAVAAVLAYRVTAAGKQGTVAHQAIWWLTVIAPVGLLVPGLFIVLTSPYAGNLLKWNNTRDVLYVYTVSALRIVPWIIAAATGISSLLDVLSNVVFYITDRASGLSSYNECNARMRLALMYAEATYDSVHVVSHSQGTVIALATLLSESPSVSANTLTTMGSPLRTLYAKYLDWPIGRPPQTWWNLFRDGDYIGGPIGSECRDEDIGVGGHTLYFCDRRIGKWLGLVSPAETHSSAAGDLNPIVSLSPAE